MKNLSFMGFPHYSVHKSGRVWSHKSNKFLSKNKKVNNYPSVTLRHDNKGSPFLVHRLVALAYLDPVEGKDIVNHKDGVKTNNDVSNLEWCTYEENNRHARETGLYVQAERSESRHLDDDTVHLICKMIEQGARNKDITDTLDLPRDYVASIRCGATYQYISCEYDLTVVAPKHRVSEDKILKVCELLESGVTCKEAARIAGVSLSTSKGIRARRIHTYFSNNFSW